MTLRTIERVPESQAGFQPHGKSMTALELVRHIATSEMMFLNGVARGQFERPHYEGLDSIGQVVTYYREQYPVRLAAVQSRSGEELAQEVAFHHLSYPAVSYLTFLLQHSAHHRGQLSVYLRLMGEKVPSIYGMSADDKEAAA